MTKTQFHIGDEIEGAVLGQLDFGTTLDHYFSTVAVQLKDGPVIKVVFFQTNNGFGPERGKPFRARVDHSIFEKPPYTSESYFMLTDISTGPRNRVATRPNSSTDPIGALNWTIRHARPR